jgi:hypothetical protein
MMLFGLKMVLNASLFHYSVCNMPDADFPIHSEIPVGYRTVPNIMVAFAVPHEMTAVFLQKLANLFFIFRHYAITA